ncbi:TetR family transcriptional regulator [Mycolicibacillus koreensis]|nr:TetR family transcriptional regulator [Mycolicibacillus koreensis]
MSPSSESAVMSGYEARWQQHNAERRVQILRAAVEVIESSPVGADISVQSIARRAGVAKSVVYRQFSGKDELERRIRSHLVDDFVAVLENQLDISTGSLREILTRSVLAVADWMADHQRLNDFARRGPTLDGARDGSDELKRRIAARGAAIIASVAEAIGVSSDAFESVPFVVVTMVDATLASWLSESPPARTRDQMAAALADIIWFILDGTARSIGVVIDPDAEFATMVDGLEPAAGPTAPRG